jgi:hypothetical protein
MKLSPDAKLNIIFWAITVPIVPFIVLMLIIAGIISIVPMFRIRTLDFVENSILKFATWRNNLPIVKNAYNKANLFEFIKNSEGR